jgi:5-methyltetrahydropteroyltriglutamate--homocysteine methyltransferase
LNSFIELNNMALSRFSAEERSHIGIHTCCGDDGDTSLADAVDYASLMPSLFAQKATNFYIELTGEKDKRRVLGSIRDSIKPEQRVFVGVVSPMESRIETAEEVRDRVLEAAEYIPVAQLGTTDDCGFAPFSDDIFATRETAFEKIRIRVAGTGRATATLGVLHAG